MTIREQIESVACPKCKAEPGEKCTGLHKPGRFHFERVDAVPPQPAPAELSGASTPLRIECNLQLLDGNEKACLVLETNGHTFAEVETAVGKFIEALQERIDNRERCPFYPADRLRPSDLVGIQTTPVNAGDLVGIEDAGAFIFGERLGSRNFVPVNLAAALANVEASRVNAEVAEINAQASERLYELSRGLTPARVGVLDLSTLVGEIRQTLADAEPDESDIEVVEAEAHAELSNSCLDRFAQLAAGAVESFVEKALGETILTAAPDRRVGVVRLGGGSFARPFVGVDVARSGRDQTVVMIIGDAPLGRTIIQPGESPRVEIDPSQVYRVFTGRARGREDETAAGDVAARDLAQAPADESGEKS